MDVNNSTFSHIFLFAIAFFFLFGFKSIEPSFPASSRYVGAWSQKNGDLETIKIITRRHFSYATFDVKNKKFLVAGGGTWNASDHTYTESLEYHTADTSLIGSSVVFNSLLEGNLWEVSITGPGKTVKETWKKVDNGAKFLAGAWRITERITPEGQNAVIPKGPRKTIKYLSDNRFQWAAFNSETKEFFGTGGGVYILKDGKYTEQISFFSRDSSRVGIKLAFNAEVDAKRWHHTGKSSTGNKVDEIWSRED